MSNIDPITKLNLLVQQRFGENIRFEYEMDLSVPHCPTITATLILPNGCTHTATAHSKKEARKRAAIEALEQRFTDDSWEEEDE